MQFGIALIGMMLIAQDNARPTPACAVEHILTRAGCPHGIAWYAYPSDTGRYIGYYVGGGSPWYRFGQDRHPWEGTWGWDYCGFCWPSRIVLDWYHGSHYQGGQGAYRTDGPRVMQH